MKRLYHLRPEVLSTQGYITHNGKDDRGLYVTLDTEVFYPRGGGQPGDQGIIGAAPREYNVIDVRTVDGIARHYLAQNTCELEIGDPVTLHVDPEQRISHSGASYRPLRRASESLT